MTAPRNWRQASESLQGRKPRLGDRFLAAGFSKDHLFEVIAAVAASTIGELHRQHHEDRRCHDGIGWSKAGPILTTGQSTSNARSENEASAEMIARHPGMSTTAARDLVRTLNLHEMTGRRGAFLT